MVAVPLISAHLLRTTPIWPLHCMTQAPSKQRPPLSVVQVFQTRVMSLPAPLPPPAPGTSAASTGRSGAKVLKRRVDPPVVISAFKPDVGAMGIVNRSTKIVIDRVYFPRPHVEGGGFEKPLGIEACAVIPFFRFWLEE